jgi:hypothetical protein
MHMLMPMTVRLRKISMRKLMLFVLGCTKTLQMLLCPLAKSLSLPTRMALLSLRRLNYPRWLKPWERRLTILKERPLIAKSRRN